MEKSGTFDSNAFFSALDAARQSKKMSWKDVAAESGVSASTLTRMAQGRRPDVDGLASLSSWAQLDTNAFIRSSRSSVNAEPLSQISTHLRGDKNLSPKSAELLDDLIKMAYERLREK